MEIIEEKKKQKNQNLKKIKLNYISKYISQYDV
jgi:hypothetical protein